MFPKSPKHGWNRVTSLPLEVRSGRFLSSRRIYLLQYEDGEIVGCQQYGPFSGPDYDAAPFGSVAKKRAIFLATPEYARVSENGGFLY